MPSWALFLFKSRAEGHYLCRTSLSTCSNYQLTISGCLSQSQEISKPHFCFPQGHEAGVMELFAITGLTPAISLP